MTNKEIKKNLKHGYIFLSIFILTPFFISFSVEAYVNGTFEGIGNKDQEESDEPEEDIEEAAEILLEIKNLEDGFVTEQESIKIDGITDNTNLITINTQEVVLNEDGTFEHEIILNNGENIISIVVTNPEGKERTRKLTIIREVEEVVPEEPEVTPEQPYIPNDPQTNPTPIPTPTPTPTREPTPVPTPEPQPEPEPEPEPPSQTLKGLKMQCSITNTAPYVGDTVSVNCTVTDQNGSPVSGAFGYVTVYWHSGSGVFTLSQSNGSGAMSTSFTVPSGSSGSVSGNVKVSKEGLNISSNFSLSVQ